VNPLFLIFLYLLLAQACLFPQILVGRGPYAEQQSNKKCKHKCGSKRARDYDFDEAERVTPSYCMIPGDFPKKLFFSHKGQSEEDKNVLNAEVVCVGANTMPGTESPEDYDAIKIRRNADEEAMFRIEDERFEVDMAIERNALAMRQIEPIAEEVAMLRETEEKDGQPIGRLQYKLKAKSLNSIQINAIGRIYGDKGDEVIEHLARNPLATVPIIYQRLRQKDQEWRKQKSELLAKWRALTETNYEGSRDFMCYQLKREIEKSLSDDRLLEECKKARSFCSSLEKRSGSSINFGLSSPDRSAVLYEPYAVVELKRDSAAHQTAVSLLTQQTTKNFGKNPEVREKMGRIWTDFVMPFFDYPARWVSDEARESSPKDVDSTIVHCKFPLFS
jgi:histone deacetylase complex regulatory component SIN3